MPPCLTWSDPEGHCLRRYLHIITQWFILSGGGGKEHVCTLQLEVSEDEGWPP